MAFLYGFMQYLCGFVVSIWPVALIAVPLKSGIVSVPFSVIGDLEIVGRSGSALRPNVFSLHVKNNGIHNDGIEGWPFRALNQKQLILHRLQNITRYIVFYRLLEAC